MISSLKSLASAPMLNATQIVLLACCVNGFVERMVADARSPSPTMLLGLSPFELLIIFVAIRELRKTSALDSARLAHFLTAGCLLIPSGAVAWVALGAFALWLAARAPANERFGPLLFIGLAVGELWVTVGFKLFATELLAIDAAITAMALNLIGFSASVDGNVVNVPGGADLLVLVSCATLHRMPLAIVSAIALAGPARLAVHAEIALLTLIGAGALNAARLVGMGVSPEWYEFLHNGAGASLYDAAQTILIFLIAMRVRP